MADTVAASYRGNIGLRSLLVVSFAAIVLAFCSSPVAAYSGPLSVSGIVCEGDVSQPFENAYVLVEVLDDSNNVKTWDDYTTAADGLYTVFWSDVPSGSTKVRVTATLDTGPQKSETRDIPGDGDLVLDIIFPYGIPQLGGMVGMAVAAVAVGSVAFVFVRKKRSA